MSAFPFETRILCVDDMAAMRLLVQQTLMSLGYSDLTFGSDGTEAWDHLELAHDAKRPFALLISDWMMPKMTGLELLRKIRSDERFKDTPVLMLTSDSELGHMLEAIKAGVNHYVTKPFTTEVLKTKMDQVWVNLQKKAGK